MKTMAFTVKLSVEVPDIFFEMLERNPDMKGYLEEEVGDTVGRVLENAINMAAMHSREEKTYLN